MLPDTSHIHSRLDLLYTVTLELNAAGLDIDRIVSRILSSAVAAVGATDATLFLFDSKNELDSFFLIRDLEIEKRSRSAPEAIPAYSLIEWVKEHRKGVIIKDTMADERWRADNLELDVGQLGSAVAIPIQLSDQLIGIIVVSASQLNFFDQSDLSMLTIIADQAVFAIANARRFEAEQHRRNLADTLTSIVHTINSTLDLTEVLNLILEQLALMIEYDSSSILLYDEESGMLSVQAARGFDDMEDALSVNLNIDEAIPNFKAIFQRKPIVIGEVDKEPNWKKSSSTRNVHSWIGAPLIAQDKIVGMLTVDSFEVNKYTAENAAVVAAFAEQAATAVVNAQAVTRLQNAEASYAALFEDSTDMIVITDYQGLILNANRTACQMLRRTKGAFIGGDIGFIHPQLSELLVAKSKRLKVWREVSIELDVFDAYRQTIPLELKARQVYYDGKDCVAWVGRDISARKEAERMRQDLINMVVHDLRGPVGNVINAIELLPTVIGSAEDNPTLNNLLEMARHSGQTVRDLVDSMLDISRLEQGQVPLQRDPVKLDELVEAVKQQVTPRAHHREMKLMFHPLPELPPIWIDGGMIRRVLINLLDNAIKYTPVRGEISLATILTENSLRFAVSDNGPGISQEDQAHIFEKFSRVDQSSGPSGVGLGLAFCQLAAVAHGGTISVESEGVPGKGSTFYLSIPIVTQSELEVIK